MKKLLIMAACLMLASCGLFNRTVTKRKLDASISTSVKVSKNAIGTTKVSAVDLSEGSRISSTPGKSGTATGRINNGVGIITDSAGLLLVALIDSLSGNLTVAYNIPGGYQADYWRGESLKEALNNFQSKSDSSGIHKESVSAKDLDKESKPNFIGTLGLWIGIGLVVVAAIWALAKFVFKK